MEPLRTPAKKLSHDLALFQDMLRTGVISWEAYGWAAEGTLEEATDALGRRASHEALAELAQRINATSV
jgi:hypothetical protein